MRIVSERVPGVQSQTRISSRSSDQIAPCRRRGADAADLARICDPGNRDAFGRQRLRDFLQPVAVCAGLHHRR